MIHLQLLISISIKLWEVIEKVEKIVSMKKQLYIILNLFEKFEKCIL